MAYYRHWVDTAWGGEKSSLGFVFSELDADDLVKELDKERLEYTKGYTSLERPMIWHHPKFTHEIEKEDYEARKKYSMPIKQIIYSPCQ